MVSVIQCTTVAPVVEREFKWTERGLASAIAAHITFEEVDAALHAPPGMRFIRRLGDVLVLMMGMAETGRVIVVVCEAIERTTTFRILRVGPATGADLDEWRRRVL
jgi:hypothetical protein